MNSRQLAILIGLILLLLATVTSAWWWFSEPAKVRLSLATGQAAGEYHVFGGLIADAVHDSAPHIEIQVVKSAGSDRNMELLSDGDVALAIVQNDTVPQGTDVHTLIPLHRGVFHFLVPTDSTIQDIHELAGKNVGVGPLKSGNLHIVQRLLAHFGLSIANPSKQDRRDRQLRDNQIWAAYEGIRTCGEQMADGEIDAILFITGMNSPALTELITSGRVRYVSVAESSVGNIIDGFAVTYPYVERYTIPRAVYPVPDARHGLPRDPCESFSLRSSLVCRGDLPDEIARSIVESIVSHRTSMMRRDQEARDITEHFDASEVQFPIHHGAMSYYQRQRPSMLERYSEPMAFILSLILAFCGLMAAFNKWLVVRKKNRIDRYYSRLDVLLEELKTADETLERLDSIESELLSMRHDAVRELVNERLLADESFQIFQSLLTDCHHQLAVRRETL